MNLFNNKIFKNILYLIIIVGSFIYNRGLGTLIILLYIGYYIYKNKTQMYALIGKMRYGKTGDINVTIPWFEKAYRTGKAKPKTLISYAYLLLKSGKIEEPDKILGEVLNKNLTDEENMIAKSNYALILWKKGQLDEAIIMLQDTYEKMKTTLVYSNLGYLLLLKGDLDKALEFNVEAYDYNDSNSIIMDNLGQTYYLRGEYPQAMEIYEKLMQANPTFPEAYYNYALVLLKQDQSEKALEMMQEALNYNFTFLSTVTKETVEKKDTVIAKVAINL